MKGLFIPDITAEMFRNACLEGIEALMEKGEMYDIEYPLEQEPNTDVLDEIMAEIRTLDDINPDDPMDRTIHMYRNEVLGIIEKHR